MDIDAVESSNVMVRSEKNERRKKHVETAPRAVRSRLVQQREKMNKEEWNKGIANNAGLKKVNHERVKTRLLYKTIVHTRTSTTKCLVEDW